MELLIRLHNLSPTGFADAHPSRKAAHLLNTIDRTGKVLDLFTEQAPEWGVTEVAATLGLAKSTTFDVLASLAEIGLLRQTSDDRYRLGWRLLLISRRLLNSTPFNNQLRRTVEQLATHLDAVVTVGAYDGQGVVCIASAAPCAAQPTPINGEYLPGHASALGKLLISQLPWTKVRARIAHHGLRALTSHTIVDVDVLRAQLLAARREDLAVEHGETIEGRSCSAVGIHEQGRHVVAALSVSVPSENMRCRLDEYVRVARRAARSLQ